MWAELTGLSLPPVEHGHPEPHPDQPHTTGLNTVLCPPQLYPGAILEVCGWKLGRFPQVQAFVRSDKPKLFRGLQIKYVRGSDPVLKLLDDNGNIAEELSILKWNTDSVEEFLSEKLERI